MISRLLPAIKAHLEKDLARLHLVSPEKMTGGNERVRAPRVFIGDFPTKRAAGSEAREFPCVLLIPLAGHSEGGEEVAEIALIAAVYNPEEGDGEAVEMDLAVLVNAIAGGLFAGSAAGNPTSPAHTRKQPLSAGGPRRAGFKETTRMSSQTSQASQPTPQEKPKAKARAARMYVGPSLLSPIPLQRGTVFPAELPAALEKATSENSDFSALFLPLSEAGAALRAIERGTGEFAKKAKAALAAFGRKTA